jgi:nucleotide-binding universal stress UspA family protein
LSRPSPLEVSAPFVDSVFHPTDFSPSSDLAFAHALAIALIRQTRFDILHAGSSLEDSWAQFPRVRDTLERWGLLSSGSKRSEVFDKLSIRVTKIKAKGDPVGRSLGHIAMEHPDLVVIATEGRDGIARWIEPSKAAKLQRRSKSMTLFVPAGCRGFVSPDDGSLSVKRILAPIDQSPDPSTALLMASRAALSLGDHPVEIEILHVGEGPMPQTTRPEGDAWTWRETLTGGDVVEKILEAARKTDLLVMATDGRDGILDAFRGSFTERVLRGVDCPVLAVPSS